jgi:hypothetical protein
LGRTLESRDGTNSSANQVVIEKSVIESKISYDTYRTGCCVEACLFNRPKPKAVTLGSLILVSGTQIVKSISILTLVMVKCSPPYLRRYNTKLR